MVTWVAGGQELLPAQKTGQELRAELGRDLRVGMQVRIYGTGWRWLHRERDGIVTVERIGWVVGVRDL